MNDTIDYIGQIHPWLTRHAELNDRHAARLAAYQDDGGEVSASDLSAYDEARYDTTIEARDFLDELTAFLRELVGPPLPGTAFTLTFAGPERHDGEAPYSFVVNGSDLPDAGRTLLHLPFFREWFTEQAGWHDDTPPDVLYLADESHPGIPEHGAFNDLRREQAGHLAAAEPPAPGNAPALPPAPPLALLG
ncbi:hypothetical protein [Streptomyces sp. NPDC088915]|uniref:hypothetical protein n=1 Tax=Streptomyces sp. NPDC088915 TaxID=3365912 RepID=UPI0037FA1C98